eukprot:5961464-Pyramimonas_sp.AAC.1
MTAYLGSSQASTSELRGNCGRPAARPQARAFGTNKKALLGTRCKHKQPAPEMPTRGPCRGAGAALPA